jgi:hypothetical protein
MLCSHVLEHLRNPQRMLTHLIPLLKDRDAFLVVALPNVAHWRVRMGLLRGKWDYTDSGIMDSIHLRFFTLDSAVRLLQSADLRVGEVLVPEFTSPRSYRQVLRNVARKVAPPGLLAGSFIFKCSVLEASQ